MYAQRRDRNEPDIIRALQQAGAYVQQMDKSAGFDLLVCFREIIYILEIKNTDSKEKSTDDLLRMLTDNELKTKYLVETTGAVYHIITSEAEALAAIGLN